MKAKKVLEFAAVVLENMPKDWLKKTTHRLDIYNEDRAKVDFLEHLEVLYKTEKTDAVSLKELPTAYDYIRLGHPLSCLLEWAVAKLNGLNAESVVSFSSSAMPILAILRKNLLDRKNTRVVYQDELPDFFDVVALKTVYGYDFDVMKVDSMESVPPSEETTVFLSNKKEMGSLSPNVDFFIACIQTLEV